MKKNIFVGLLALFTLALSSCYNQGGQSNNCQESKSHTSCSQSECTKQSVAVMTKETQESLTPDAVLKDLMEGNERYVTGSLKKRDFPAQVVATTEEQFPKAVILACMDSRVPVEYIFDQGVGDIFVARVAGNIEDEELVGSMEYGTGVAGAKLIMVLGHENCGAVKSAINKVDVGSTNVTTLLEHVECAIEATEGERDAKNKCYVDQVIKNNVSLTAEGIRSKSNIIKTLEEEGKVKIVCAYYSLTDGKVTILDSNTSCCKKE